MKIARISFVALAAACITLCGCSTESKTASTGSEASMAAFNTECPISHGKVNSAAKTVNYNGKTVGFCCNGCPEKFQTMTDEQKAKAVASVSAK